MLPVKNRRYHDFLIFNANYAKRTKVYSSLYYAIPLIPVAALGFEASVMTPCTDGVLLSFSLLWEIV